MNRKVIKLTLKQLLESQGDAFNFLTGGDMETYDGMRNVYVSGKQNIDTDGEPVTTDDFASKLSSQMYGRFGYAYPRPVRENDSNGDGVDDFYNNEEMDTLSNGDNADDLTRIPQGVSAKVDSLLKQMSFNTLSPKQQAMVLNKMVEACDVKSIPYSWKKELMKKISNNTESSI
ncbi:MAG: hypothetical protein J6Y37_13455 [Paludibacteraceae bacterium]|nr:hypothetical protein [Paludibacteraceae bacterium]